jgi:CheY-specific phosphatase CheX
VETAFGQHLFWQHGSAVSDAVGELTNMISSVARAKLTKIGLELGMALPFTVIGKGVGVDTALTGEGHCTILKTKSGNFQLAVVLADSRSK